MKEIRILGTGHAAVTKCYNTCFAMQGNAQSEYADEFFLVDAGGGNQILNQLEVMNIPLSHIHHFFISHTHTDHITGAIWIIRSISYEIMSGRYQGNLHIYGHDQVIGCIQSMIHFMLGENFEKKLGNRYVFHILEDGDQAEILGEKVTFFDIHSTKMKQFGFVIRPTNLIFAGDEPYNLMCDPYTKGMDILMHEAFCLESQSDLYHPERAHHSTPVKAALTATRLGVKELILYHTEDQNYKTKSVSYKKEAEQYFNGKVIVPMDLEVIPIDEF